MQTNRFWIVFRLIKTKHPTWSNKKIAIVTRYALARSEWNYDEEIKK